MPVPFSWPKSAGFTFLPPGTVRQHDAGKWALYYNPAMNASFFVIDKGDWWKINHHIGKMKVTYAKDYAASKPCCQ